MGRFLLLCLTALCSSLLPLQVPAVHVEITAQPAAEDGLYSYTVHIINSTNAAMRAQILDGSNRNITTLGVSHSEAPAASRKRSIRARQNNGDGTSSSSSSTSDTGSTSSVVGLLGSSSSSESASDGTSSSSSSACEFGGGCTSSASAACPIDGNNNTVSNSSTSSSLCGSGSSTDSASFISIGPLNDGPLIGTG
nr:hypothetical protein CFP56_65849 [Quercus suber]